MSLREPAPGSRSARGRDPALYRVSAHRPQVGAYLVHPCSVPVPTVHPIPIPRSGRSPNAQIQTSSPGFSISTNSWGWWCPQHPGPTLPQPRSASLGPGLAPGRFPPFPRSPSPAPAAPPAPAPSCRCRTGTRADTGAAGAPGPRRSRSGSPAPCSRARHPAGC